MLSASRRISTLQSPPLNCGQGSEIESQTSVEKDGVELIEDENKKTNAETEKNYQDSEETDKKTELLYTDLHKNLTPFGVKPSEGVLLPGESTTIEVSFQPLEAKALSATLFALITNSTLSSQPTSSSDESASPSMQVSQMELPNNTLMGLPSSPKTGFATVACKLPVTGLARSPLVHFELAESDYLAQGRRNQQNLPGPGLLDPTHDPETRIIEFEAVGMGVKVIR
ncbi:unnamed protein product [Protopolystoma xenopodis]|uniref:HYDIN/VesB/CFA65-like Ig-like domain-containing protein n=1 Tax=Protopolystoma xenopodis TaxID=117903 RepID=A0A448WUW1_9PLAT|nr:unnamed protein product [Protopolystoma xenopodis]